MFSVLRRALTSSKKYWPHKNRQSHLYGNASQRGKLQSLSCYQAVAINFALDFDHLNTGFTFIAPFTVQGISFDTYQTSIPVKPSSITHWPPLSRQLWILRSHQYMAQILLKLLVSKDIYILMFTFHDIPHTKRNKRSLNKLL